MNRRWLPLLAAFLVAPCFWWLGYATLRAGHPFEDAYILFAYVENLVAGHGIVFYPGGPPTAGATDFLWLLLLAGLHSLGMDVALAAVFWNGLGAGLATWVFFGGARTEGRPPLVAAAAMALYVLLFHGANAALGGFSSLLFAALGLLAFERYLAGKSHGLLCLAVLLALFRPEGVALALGSWILGLQNARRGAALASYLWLTLPCVLLGLLYLYWRQQYFGLYLPLSVHVKAGYASLAGLGTNLRWLYREIGPLPLLLASTWFSLVHRRQTKAAEPTELRRLLLGLLPVLLLLLALCFASQSQNVRWRFQAPVSLCLAYFCWRLFLAAHRSQGQAGWLGRTSKTGLVLLLACLPALVVGIRRTSRQLFASDPLYTWSFAQQMGTLLGPEDTLALTEAGILAYWSRSRIVDLVGLNDLRFALRPPRVQDLEEMAPAVLLFNSYDTLDPVLLDLAPGTSSVPVEPSTLRTALGKWRMEDLPGYAESGLDHTQAAALVMVRFLAKHDDYQVQAVRVGRNIHVYAFRRAHKASEKLLQALGNGLSRARQPSYLALKARP